MGNNKLKGTMKTLEAVLAASILLIGMGFIFMPKTSSATDGMKEQGYSALQYLADSGELRKYAESEQNIDILLDPLLDYNFKGMFCKEGCKTDLPDNKEIVIVDYYISGYASSDGIKSDPKRFRLYLWHP
ncbi:MAG: hypothetical protein HZB65_02685 [Candidatus Aenigmarchaeota archaeon]|nr:hypothetical protein [Candidatus Aenigmarchaeota archaeon]